MIKKLFKKIIQKTRIFFLPCQENHYRAKFLASNFLFYYLLFLLVLKLLVVPVFVYLPSSALFASLSKAILIELTNQQRQSFGLKVLQEDAFLNDAALQKAQDMLELDYFGHNSPKGTSPWYWFKEAGYEYQKAGENLGIGFLDAEEIFQAWNDSFPHKKNIINPGYEDIGIAILKGDFQGNETTVVVQLFGSRMQKPAIIEEVSAQEEIPSTPPQEGVEVKEEKIEEIPKQKETLPEQAAIPSLPEFDENGLEMKFLKFMTINYLSLIQKIIFYSSLLIIVILCLSVLKGIDVKPQDLLIKAVFFILMFSLFVFLDKEILLNFIPHALSIN